MYVYVHESPAVYLPYNVLCCGEGNFDGAFCHRNQEVLNSFLYSWSDVLLQLRILLQQSNLVVCVCVCV